MRTLKWVILNGLFMVALWLGLREGVQGAANAAVFFSWVMFVSYLACSLDSVVKDMADLLTESPVPGWLDRAYDLLVVAFLAWHAYWLTAVAFLAAAAALGVAREKAKKLRAARAANA